MRHLVEQHVISRKDERFAPIDAAAFVSKNLYNAALYEVRQAFIFEGRYLDYYAVYARMKGHEAYRALPAKVAQQVLRLLDKNWQSYFAACEAYREAPSKFRKPPKMPHYKPKQDGRNLLVYTTQALSHAGLKAGLIQPSKLSITIETKKTRIAQVRIVPRTSYYVVEVVYERAENGPSGNPLLYAAIDIGVDNLAAITANKKGFVPRLVNGRVLKSWNQFYNKRRAELQAALGHPGTTQRMERLTTKRTRRINQYLHEASRAIMALLVEEGIGTLVVGKNPGWKMEAELGRVNNQHFVQLPHARFIGMLEYKAKLAGIRFVLEARKLHQQGILPGQRPHPHLRPQAGRQTHLQR
jgi:putative transposase